MEPFNYTERARKVAYRYPFLSSLGLHFGFWTVSYMLFILIRHFFLQSLKYVTDIPIPSNLGMEILEGLGLSTVYALLVGVISYYFDKRLPSLSIGFEILIRSASYFVAFLFVWTAGSIYFTEYIATDLVFPDEAVENQFYALLLYTAVSVVLFGYISQVNKTYGPGVLIPILLGYYRKPQREYRIFMFADLTSSTTYAEQLGREKYSLLIQECFRIANKIVPQHDAQIYQYVGDEIVLVWQASRQQDFINALEYHFHFQQELERREETFKSTMGVAPKFKTGLNCGEITVVEVGNIKRDIAYHGDNINIASRLEALCNTLDKSILVSEGFYNLVKDRPEYNFEFVQEVQLKGKLKKTNVYTVSRNQSS